MQTHDDKDARKHLGALAELMTERGENRITAGAPGEQPLTQWWSGGVFVRQMPADPYALRISIGEAYAINEAAYFVFRGDKERVLLLLERALAALRNCG
jgi:hypothetical protein